jgi:hypothetical protein
MRSKTRGGETGETSPLLERLRRWLDRAALNSTKRRPERLAMKRLGMLDTGNPFVPLDVG